MVSALVERVLWAIGSCTVLVLLCQLLVLLLYPLLVPRSKSSRKFQPLQRVSNSIEAIPIRPLSSTTSSTIKSRCCGFLFPSNRAEWAPLIEAFFLGLAVSTLISDALFHLIPEALLSAIESSTPSSSINHSDHSGVLHLGFWALFGMVLVVVIEGIVHSNLSLSTLCGGCCQLKSINRNSSSRGEKLELGEVRALSTGSSCPDHNSILHHSHDLHHHHGSHIHQTDECHSNSSTDESTHNEHEHHQQQHQQHHQQHGHSGGHCGGSCNHGFAHLIVEDDTNSNSSEQQEEEMEVDSQFNNNDDDAILLSQQQQSERLYSKNSRRHSIASISRRSLSISSTREQTDESPTSTDQDGEEPDDDDDDVLGITEDDDGGFQPSTRHYKEASKVMRVVGELERPQTAPGDFRIVDSKIRYEKAITGPATTADGHHCCSDDLHRSNRQRRYSYQFQHAHNSAKQKMLRSTAWANLIAELLHNFVDGIAIGIAFLSGSPAIGIATSIAIFAHEVPSQIADFIILLRGGLSPIRAYCLNFGVAFGIHIGALAALLGTPESFHTALQMLAAGNFLCLGLSMILPQLRDLLRQGNDHQHHHNHERSKQAKWQSRRLVFGSSIGLISGVGLMALLAVLGT